MPFHNLGDITGLQSIIELEKRKEASVDVAGKGTAS